MVKNGNHLKVYVFQAHVQPIKACSRVTKINRGQSKTIRTYKGLGCLRSVAGLVIQATGRTELEDGLRLGCPRGVLSDNPSVRTSSLVTLVL